jgi:hypothetical protein
MWELSPAVRVLVMTGAGRELELKGCQLLRKPFTLAQFSEQVDRALA